MTRIVALVLTLLVAMTLPSMFSELPSQANGLDTRQQTSTRGDSARRHGIETPHSGSPGSVTGSVTSRITQRTDSSPTVVLPRWPMQGHDAQRTGRVVVSGPVTNTVSWTYQFNDFLFNGRLQDQASPIVGPDGTIYQPTEGFFYAINPNGTFKWSLDFSSFGMRNAPALSPDGNTVYIVDNFGVAALDAQNGNVLWRYPFGAGEDVSYSSMAVDGNGTIYVGTRLPAALYAVHPDGTLKWRYAVPGGASLGIEAAPAIDVNGYVYVEINGTGLVALDADGNYRWTAAPGGDYGWYTPTIGPDGTIYVAGDQYGQDPNHDATALNPDGSVKWQKSASEIGAPWAFAGMAISADGSTVYTGRANGKVYALDAATGGTRWVSEIAASDAFSGSPALSDNGILYLTSWNGYVYAVWAGDGSLLWQYELETYPLNWGAQSPALGPDGTLYAVSSGNPPASGGIRGRLYAFRDSGCWFMLNSMSQSFAAAGGTGSINVTAGEASCDWTAVSNDTFITINSGSSGTGNGTVEYSVDANPLDGPRSGTMTIAGRTFRVNQAGIVPPTFSISDVTHNEGNAGTTSYTFTVTRTGSTPLNTSVNFTTVDGSATTADNDYQSQSGTLTFLPAYTTRRITVIVNGDTTFEPDETFTVHLSDASGATISDADGTGTITNDDAPPPPALGNYPDASVQVGGNTTVTPDSAPTSTTSINVSTVSAFRGTFAASPATGVVHVTNAQPAGSYTVTLKAFNSAGVTTTKTFTLTVNNPMPCDHPTFSAASGSPFAVGSVPTFAAVGDFNGDGTQDFAVANWGSNNVTVLLGNGSGGFSAATGSPFAVGSHPASIAVADFNGDGRQDLAIANSGSHNVTVLLGDGGGGFSAVSGSPFSVGGLTPESVVMGDFNGDSKPDLAIANWNTNNVTVLLGNGSGSFSPATGSPFAVGTNPSSVATADFNGDGKTDLATANYWGDNVTVLLGNGAGGFSPAIGSPFALAAGSHPDSVAAGDFNGDGKQDLATANYLSNNVAVLLGDGSGGFSPAPGSPITVVANPYSVVVADYNGDGKLDLATANLGSNNATVLLGNGSGGFSISTGSPFAVGSSPICVAAGDFNGDGKLDLAAANQDTSNLTVLLNTCTSNTAPTISAVGVTRQQGSPSANATIANVNDLEDPATALSVTVNGGVSATVNGVTVSGISVDGAGVVTANVVASCTATTATFTLRATDTGSLFNEATLTVTVNPNTAPTLTYATPQAVILGGSLNVSPTAAGDNGTVSYSVLAGHGLITAPTVDASGVVSITNAQPPGAHTVTIRATDNCGDFTDAAFTLNVGEMPTFTIDDVTHNEGNSGTTAFIFTVTKTGSTTLNSSVNFATADGTATTANNDYQANSDSLTFLPTDTTKQITVLVNGDTTFEPSETFTVHLSGASGATISDADGTGTITNDDAAPSLTIDDVTHNEGNSGTTAFVFTVTKNGSTALNLSVDFTTVDGSAMTADNDYQANSGTLNFLPTDTTKQITVLVNGDTTFEPDETFTVHLSGVTIGAGLHAPSTAVGGTGTIINDDVAPPTLGTYPDTSVALGANATVTPDAAPTNATSINVSSSTNFKGTFSADPATGVVRVTNAHPAGTYAVTVTPFNGSTPGTAQTFTLTVTDGTACAAASIFTNAADSSVGLSPLSVAIGDFNNDGKQDIAVANENSFPRTVSIRLGDGAGGFSGTTEVSVGGSDPVSVAIGDFNNDGKQDIAVANNLSNTVSIRLGDGAGGFSGTTEVSVGTTPQTVTIGDFNGDGKQDFAAANFNSATVSIRLGDGAGGFSGATEVSVGSNPQSVAIGDFNNDGKQDLAVTNRISNTVSIRLGDGAGGFSGTTEVSVGSQPLSVAIGDFNNDGKQDIAAANFGSTLGTTVSIRLGDGAGGFSGTTEVSVGTGPVSVAIGDFNNDGKQDIAAANYTSNTVSIRLGDGAGGFSGTTEVSVGSTPQWVAIGDFNNDGKQDMAVANSSSTTVSIRLGACNLPPTIAAATGLSRQQGTPASNSQIATVTDDGGNGSVNVTVTSANPSNGVTISNILNTGGNVTADIVADCTATTATFTLQASDGSLTATDTLTVTVTANTAPALTYASPQSVIFGGSLSLSPTTTGDNGPVTYSVQAGHGLTTAPTVDSGGVVSITNAQPSGAHTVTIRATDNCGAFTDAAFTLNVGAAPSFTIDDVTHFEGNAGTTAYLFTVTKTGVTALSSSVNFQTQDGSATLANNDYQLNSGTLNFGPTDTTMQITVLVNGDTNFEPDEAFTVHLSGASGATISDADGTGTIINDDCSFSLSSNTENFSAADGMSSVNVITGTGCAWIAVSNDAFITVNSGTPGSGNGAVNYTVAANTGPARMGTMTIAGKTFTVTQDSGCTFSLNRDHQSFPGNGGTGTVNLTASDPACDWTASTTSTFIHITSGSSGTGNGAVQYSVDVNPGPTIRSDTITIAGQTFTVYQGIDFGDVPSNDPFYNDIGKLAARNVTVGCGSGNFCPNNPVTREQMAAFIMRAKGEFNPPPPASQRFGDVPPENPFYNLIDRLAAVGITVGCSTTPPLYCPSAQVTREQMAVFILRALGEFNPPTPGSQRFDDVPPASSFYNFIDRMAVLGITVGCQASPPLYCPTASVTRAQMAAFLVRAFKL